MLKFKEEEKLNSNIKNKTAEDFHRHIRGVRCELVGPNFIHKKPKEKVKGFLSCIFCILADYRWIGVVKSTFDKFQ